MGCRPYFFFLFCFRIDVASRFVKNPRTEQRSVEIQNPYDVVWEGNCPPRSMFRYCGTLDCQIEQRFYFHLTCWCFLVVVFFPLLPQQWCSAPHGREAQWRNTSLPASRQPSSAPSVLIHLTVASHRLVHPFHNFKALLYPVPLGRGCPYPDHTGVHMLFRVIWPAKVST